MNAYLNRFTAAFLIVFVFVVTSCDEVPPLIDYTPVIEGLIDTTYVDGALPPSQDRVVLIEEFTGVQCVNCPTGHAATKVILDDHPNNVAVIALHNYFAGPFPFSNEDYMIEEAIALDGFLGPAVGWPAGTIDRFKFPTEGGIVVVDAAKWAGLTNTRLADAVPVNIELTPDYEASTNTFTVLTHLHFLEDVTEDLKISIMLTENEIVDAQTTLSGVDTFYVHEHILRDMMTPFNGSAISTTTEQGRVIMKEFQIELEEHWDADHMEVVAFVHFATASKEILQTAKSGVTD